MLTPVPSVVEQVAAAHVPATVVDAAVQSWLAVHVDVPHAHEEVSEERVAPAVVEHTSSVHVLVDELHFSLSWHVAVPQVHG